MRLQIDNAGFAMDVEVPDDQIASIHRVILDRLNHEAAERGRAIGLIAGPPGSGKSTLCGIWRALAAEWGLSLAAVSLDGFHLTNAMLAERGLADRKGSPESFDLDAFRAMLHRVREGEHVVWPVYDRNLHDPRPDGTPVGDERLVLVEGNYVLLDRAGWRHAVMDADLTVMIHTDRRALRDRVIARHMRGGMDHLAAERKFRHNDEPNIELVEVHSLRPDISLMQSADGGYRLFRE